SSNPAFTCSNTANTATCTAASFASGATTVITINSIAPNAAGSMGLNASINSTTGDPNGANNLSTGTVTVNASADVAVSKTGPATAYAGQAISYVITVSNLGPSVATSILVTDTTTPALTPTSVGGACTALPCT